MELLIKILKEYNIEKETLKKTGMKWEELNSIYDSYCRLEPQLKKIGKKSVTMVATKKTAKV